MCLSNGIQGQLVPKLDFTLTWRQKPIVIVAPIVGSLVLVALEDVLEGVVRRLSYPCLLATVQHVLGHSKGWGGHFYVSFV